MNEGFKKWLWEMVDSIAIALILAFLIRTFIIQPFYIPSGSMYPNLQPNDKVLVNKFIYYFAEPKRGEIMVFHYPLDTKKDYIKRIVGLENGTVEVKDSQVYINGKVLNEPYLPQGLEYGNFGPFKVPAGNYFMMGDNRPDSQDSRYWGSLDKKLIIGKATIVFWPPKRVMLLRN